MAALFEEIAHYGPSGSVTSHHSSPCSTYSSPTTSPPPIDPLEEPDPAECPDNESNKLSTAFLNLISRIPTKNTIKFNTPTALAGHIQRRIRWCYQNRNGCYVPVTQVTEEQVTGINDAFHERGIDKIGVVLGGIEFNLGSCAPEVFRREKSEAIQHENRLVRLPPQQEKLAKEDPELLRWLREMSLLTNSTTTADPVGAPNQSLGWGTAGLIVEVDGRKTDQGGSGL